MANNFNGAFKVFGGLVALITLVVVITLAVIAPMKEQVTSIKGRLLLAEEHARKNGHPESVAKLNENLERRFDDHIKSAGHPETLTKIEGIMVMFTEVEEQFEGVELRVLDLEANKLWDQHDELIRLRNLQDYQNEAFQKWMIEELKKP